MWTEIAWGSYDPSHICVYEQGHFWAWYTLISTLELGTTEVHVWCKTTIWIYGIKLLQLKIFDVSYLFLYLVEKLQYLQYHSDKWLITFHFTLHSPPCADKSETTPLSGVVSDFSRNVIFVFTMSWPKVRDNSPKGELWLFPPFPWFHPNVLSHQKLQPKTWFIASSSPLKNWNSLSVQCKLKISTAPRSLIWSDRALKGTDVWV